MARSEGEDSNFSSWCLKARGWEMVSVITANLPVFLGGLHDVVVAVLGWPERVSVDEAKIGPSEWFIWKDEENIVDYNDKGYVAAFGNVPGVWTMRQLRFKDDYGHLWWEHGNRRLRGELEIWGWLWKGKEVKLRVILVGGDTCEMIWRHMQDVHGNLQEGTEVKATGVKEIWKCSKSI